MMTMLELGSDLELFCNTMGRVIRGCRKGQGGIFKSHTVHLQQQTVEKANRSTIFVTPNVTVMRGARGFTMRNNSNSLSYYAILFAAERALFLNSTAEG